LKIPLRIPKRLSRIYELAEGKELWDIGCDHSILAQINLDEKKFSIVHCVDKSKLSLNKIIQSVPFEKRGNVNLINSDGCDIDWSQVRGSVVIAGVGGHTVLKVVASCPIEIRKKIVWILNPFTSVDLFIKEIAELLPGSTIQKHEMKEAGRDRAIFKWNADPE
jgi:tRNA A22 N-methylase